MKEFSLNVNLDELDIKALTFYFCKSDVTDTEIANIFASFVSTSLAGLVEDYLDETDFRDATNVVHE